MRLLPALLVSTLIHLLAGGGFPWPTGDFDELPSPPIDARILPSPAPPARTQTDMPHPAKARPASPATSQGDENVQDVPIPVQAPLPQASEPSREQEPVAATAPQPTAQEPAPVQTEAPSTPPVPLHPQLPSGFTVRYVVQGSEGGLTLGHLEHIWQRDEARYSLYALARATGLVRLISSGLLSQTSFGQITPEGLKPEHYWLQRGSRQLQAHFDWASMRADLGERYPPLELKPGSQDLLSVIYQLALFPHTEEALWVLDGKTAKAYRVQFIDRERVSVPLGTLQTRHLRIEASEGPERIDVWLKEDPPHLPLKIHMQGGRIGSAVLIAESIRGLPLAAQQDTDHASNPD